MPGAEACSLRLFLCNSGIQWAKRDSLQHDWKKAAGTLQEEGFLSSIQNYYSFSDRDETSRGPNCSQTVLQGIGSSQYLGLQNTTVFCGKIENNKTKPQCKAFWDGKVLFDKKSN